MYELVFYIFLYIFYLQVEHQAFYSLSTHTRRPTNLMLDRLITMPIDMDPILEDTEMSNESTMSRRPSRNKKKRRKADIAQKFNGRQILCSIEKKYVTFLFFSLLI